MSNLQSISLEITSKSKADMKATMETILSIYGIGVDEITGIKIISLKNNVWTLDTKTLKEPDE